jgi:GNAT superfamily N-acetyltransferase
MPQLESQPITRLATIDEAPVISLVLREAFAEYASLYTAAALAATTPTSEQIEKRWNEGPVWVAEFAGHIVGTVAAVPKHQALYIRSMAIRPTARGHGLGQLLLEQVDGFAKRQAVGRMFLSTTPFLYHAIRLYNRFGFIQTNEGPYELHGTPLFTMEKPVLVNSI